MVTSTGGFSGTKRRGRGMPVYRPGNCEVVCCLQISLWHLRRAAPPQIGPWHLRRPRQYLAAGLIDELHLANSAVLLGRGEHLLAGIDTVGLGYKCAMQVSTDSATQAVLTK